jgi:hypothetical protein
MCLAPSLIAMRQKRNKQASPTSELTPNRGGDFVDEERSLREDVPDPGSVQSNHALRGLGTDDERADADDAKVKGRSRPS